MFEILNYSNKKFKGLANFGGLLKILSDCINHAVPALPVIHKCQIPTVAGGSNRAGTKITFQKRNSVVAHVARKTHTTMCVSCCAIKSWYLEETCGFSVARSNQTAPNGPKCNYS